MFSIVFELTGIFITLIIILLYAANGRIRREPYRAVSICMTFNILTMFFDLLALYFRYQTGTAAWYGVRITNFLSFFCSFTSCEKLYDFFTEYMDQHVKMPRKSNRVIHWITVTMYVLLVLNIFCPIFYYFDPQYTRADFFAISQLPGLIMIWFCIYYTVKYRFYLKGYEIFAVSLYFSIPFIALLVQIRVYGLAILGFAGSVSGSIIFLFLQLEHEGAIAAAQRDMMEKQISVSVSQIQPHFISNALNTIQYLCTTDPEQAGEITGNFAQYLRMNIDSYSIREPVDFTTDLKHLDHYLCIERLRYPDIRFIYRIDTTDFKIPPITLQPLVENAIRHGVRHMEENGVIEISTREAGADKAVIRISDNGAGFDPSVKPSDDRSHVGLENTRERLKIMCGGTMEVQSAPGKGTVVTITVPKNQ